MRRCVSPPWLTQRVATDGATATLTQRHLRRSRTGEDLHDASQWPCRGRAGHVEAATRLHEAGIASTAYDFVSLPDASIRSKKAGIGIALADTPEAQIADACDSPRVPHLQWSGTIKAFSRN